MTLNHIHLGSLSVERSERFYTTFFGFHRKPGYEDSHAGGVFLENSSGFLLVIDPVERLPELPTWFHFGFCLGTEQAVHTMYGDMMRLGAKFARELKTESGEFASFFVFDPDGYRLEVSWHRE